MKVWLRARNEKGTYNIFLNELKLHHNSFFFEFLFNSFQSFLAYVSVEVRLMLCVVKIFVLRPNINQRCSFIICPCPIVVCFFWAYLFLVTCSSFLFCVLSDSPLSTSSSLIDGTEDGKLMNIK